MRPQAASRGPLRRSESESEVPSVPLTESLTRSEQGPDLTGTGKLGKPSLPVAGRKPAWSAAGWFPVCSAECPWPSLWQAGVHTPSQWAAASAPGRRASPRDPTERAGPPGPNGPAPPEAPGPLRTQSSPGGGLRRGGARARAWAGTGASAHSAAHCCSARRVWNPLSPLPRTPLHLEL